MSINTSLILSDLEKTLSRKEEVHKKIKFLADMDPASDELTKLVQEMKVIVAVEKKAGALSAVMNNMKEQEQRRIEVIEEIPDPVEVVVEAVVDTPKEIVQVDPDEMAKPPVTLYKKVPKKTGVSLGRELNARELAMATSIETWKKLIFEEFERKNFIPLYWAWIVTYCFDMNYRPDNFYDDIVNPPFVAKNGQTQVESVWSSVLVLAVQKLIEEGKLIKDRDSKGKVLLIVTDYWRQLHAEDQSRY